MSSTLRSRLMSIVLGPAIVFLAIISAIFTYGTLRDVAINEKNIHQTYAEQIAAHSYLLYRNQDIDGLQLTAQTSLEHAAIRSITFYDLAGNSIAHAGPIQPPLTPQINSLHDLNLRQDYRRAMVTLPIKPMEISSRVQQGTRANHPEIGWVQIQFSFTSLILQSYQSVFINLLITIGLLGLLYGVVVAFSNKLTRRLRELVKQITHNQISSNAPTRIKELDELELAISDLKKQQIEKLNQAHQQLETAENDLYTTIEAIEIKNIELDIARREAVRSNKSKSEFLANTSHELRTPLNSIIGFSSLLMRSGSSQQQREHARAIHDSSQNLLVLINDILDLSRLEANRFVLNNEAFDLRDTVESTLSFVASSAHLKNLELSYSVYSDIPPALVGDANRIRQILTNLLGNAIKFSDQGAVQLRVSLEHLFDTEAVIHFEVQDQGPGLPNGKQATIFAPFTQFDNSNTREETGTGLGLSICYKLIQQMNGDLDYHSEPGNTRFWFTVRLPIASSDHSNNTQPEINTSHFSPRLILVDEQNQSRHTSAHLMQNFFADIQQLDSFSQFLANTTQQVHDQDTALIAVPVNCSSEQLEQLSAWCRTRKHTTLLALPCNIELTEIAALPAITTFSKPVTRQRLYQALATNYKGEQAALSTADNTTTAADAAQPPLSDTLQGVRILLADDIPNNARLFAALLAPHGALLTFAENGEQAFQHFKTERFDIVMLDIQMPVMDGLQACQLMRQWESERAHSHTPILAVTAFSDNEQRSTIQAAGMDDMLTKPIDEQRLLDAITQYVKPLKKTAPNTAETPTTAAIFSYSKALQRCSNRPDIAKSMLQQLLQLLPQERADLEQAAAQCDRENMQQIAHKLSGASSYCGTDNLMQASKALDKHCRVAAEQIAQQQAAQHLIAAIDELLTFSARDTVLKTLLSAA